MGHPVYNLYRPDIAALFPGYANFNGAVGYFAIVTTVYENGIHTIQWTATDNAGNTDGIGSRYFTIDNGCTTISSRGLSRKTQESPLISMETLNELPMDYAEPVTIKKGYQAEQDIHSVFPNNDGISVITIKELERLEIQVSTAAAEIYGYLVVGDKLKGLPVGSFLDGKSGVFHWQPGPGFVGEYRFVFVEKKPNGEMSRRNISVEILPGM